MRRNSYIKQPDDNANWELSSRLAVVIFFFLCFIWNDEATSH